MLPRVEKPKYGFCDAEPCEWAGSEALRCATFVPMNDVARSGVSRGKGCVRASNVVPETAGPTPVHSCRGREAALVDMGV